MRAYLLSKDTAGITIAITLVLAMMVPTVLARTQNVLPNGGKCMGFKTSPTYCKFIEMPNGSVILNVNWTIGAYTIDANELYAGDPYVGSTDQIPRTETQTQPVSSDSNNDNDDGGGNTEDEGQDVKDAQSGGGAILCNDPDWSGEGTCIDPSVPKCNGTDEICYTEDGDIKNLEKQPYCDEVSDGSGCWDRKDNDQDTGLYPCKDGSYKEDWRDCNGDDDNGNDNNNGEDDDNDRILPSCSNVVSGTACDNSGEEDSWLDDPTEYYTEDDIQDEEEYEEDDSTE